MKKHSMLLTAIALVLILSLSIGSALAYFSDFATSIGQQTVTTGTETTITEPDPVNYRKVVTVHNKDNSKVAVFIRATAFSSDYSLTYSGSGWTSQGGYWYYNGVVEPGGDTSELAIQINNVPAANSPDVADGDFFNVIVVYESVPAMYDDNGDPYPSTYAKAWEQEITTG